MGFSKLFLAGRILQRGGLRRVGSRVLSTSKSRSKKQCDDTTQRSAVTNVMAGDCRGLPIQDDKRISAVVGAYIYGKDGIYELSNEAKRVDKGCGGKLSKELNEVQQYMDVGKVFVVTDVGKYSAVAIVGYGHHDASENYENQNVRKENARWGAGAGVKAMRERGARVIEVDPGRPGKKGEGGGVHDATAEAALLAAWQFDHYKADKQPPAEIVLLSGCTCKNWPTGLRRGHAQNWARYLSDMPANEMTPIKLAEEVIRKLCPPPDQEATLTVVAHDRAWIEAQGMEAFLAVARGSCEEPVFLECKWRVNDGPTVLVAAKGVTFDCGGICLKQHEQMMENRGCMAGAAAALGAMLYVKESKMNLNVTMVIPVCENMVSGQCLKVGDVVKTGGIHVKVEDTDMEGRLMLADALVYGQAAHKPETVIDVATLTHGIQVATGNGAFGAFTDDEELWTSLQTAGRISGDRPWRFPLWDYYQRRITDNPSFDLRNRGSEHASPCVGAAFLRNFVCGKWIHMDTTGVAKLVHDEPPYLSRRRMSGRPTRTLICLLEELAKKKTPPPEPPQCS